MTAADAISDFVKSTANRLPTLEEVLTLCDACRIKLKVKDGEPIMALPGACLNKCGQCNYCYANAAAKRVSEVVQELIGREPWRSQVIERRIQENAA